MSSSKMTAEGERRRAQIRGAMSARSNTGTARGATLFVALRKVWEPYKSALMVVRDEPGDFSVQTPEKAFFGGVRASREHTSFYLPKLFASPSLLEKVSPHLRPRIVGASFAFKTVEPALFEELGALVEQCLRA